MADLKESAVTAKAGAFDPDREGEAPKGVRLRPKDAATLLLVRRDRGSPEVLMGRRAQFHAFMPGKYVFPGGRVDPADGAVPAVRELGPATTAQLATAARRRPRAFAIAAIRELWEETGLVLGEPAAVSPAWTDFQCAQAAPALDRYRLIARAITPPGRARRFDARFFLGFAEEALLDARSPRPCAELEDVHWVRLSDAFGLDLPAVTRFVLAEAQSALGDPHLAPAFLKMAHGASVVSRL